MGYYVNPPTMTKEDFLEKFGKKAPLNLKFSDIPNDSMAVVLLNNGPFTAAGIAYSPRELEEFTDPNDYRPKKVFIVKKTDLRSIGCRWPE